jgi:aryl-alcohol dehydrogenase-like predicted oxidoreductase
MGSGRSTQAGTVVVMSAACGMGKSSRSRLPNATHMALDQHESRRLAFLLQRSETAHAAIEALRGATDRISVEALLDLIHAGPSAALVTAAIDALEAARQPIVLDTLTTLLESSWPSVRAAAIVALRPRLTESGVSRTQLEYVRQELARLVNEDESWTVRRQALAAWFELTPDVEFAQGNLLAVAATDPHWRVRHALIEQVLNHPRRRTTQLIAFVHTKLAEAMADARAEGVLKYLRWQWSSSGRSPPEALSQKQGTMQAAPWWNWDPAVLARNLDELGDDGGRQMLDGLPHLIAHDDEQVQRRSAAWLLRWGQPRHFAESARVLDDPRRAASPTVRKLLDRLDPPRRAETVAIALAEDSTGPLAWAIGQLVTYVAADPHTARVCQLMETCAERPAQVRRALAGLAARWPHFQASERLDAAADRAKLAGDWSWRVRKEAALELVARQQAQPEVAKRLAALQADDHPQVRAAALTHDRAAQIVARPELETSWTVIARAAELCRKPIWELMPAEAAPPIPPPARPSFTVSWPNAGPALMRELGSARLPVSAIGVSGHYGLPEAGFARAIERGVNLFFWEPNYDTLTRFTSGLAASDRRPMHFIAGTFEADADAIRRDAERALRRLKIERLALFLLFWTRDWTRVSDEVRRTLDDLQSSGTAAMCALSTHSRPLALEAIAGGWNPVMVRHSAAHRGAEEQIFAQAAAAGTSLITFNNTCYGRLLEPAADLPPVSAADCYRYSLSFPAVTVCLSAPATVEQLEENLAVLGDPALPAERRAQLLAKGDLVYRHDCIFRELVRF